MIKSFRSEEFANALAEGKLREPITLTGIVKQYEDVRFLHFSPGKSCQQWVRIPVKIIDKVDWLGKVSCLDRTYDYVQLLLKEVDDPILQDFTTVLRSYSNVLSQPLPNLSAQLTPVQNLPTVDVLAEHQLGKDQSLLSLMKSFDSVESLQIPFTPSARLAAVTTYKVHIRNLLSQLVDEVVLFFKRNSDPPGAIVHSERMTNVIPNQNRYFDLGTALDMQSYAVGGYIGEQTVLYLPPPGTGPMTPARVAQQYPQNHIGPYDDLWRIGVDGLP